MTTARNKNGPVVKRTVEPTVILPDQVDRTKFPRVQLYAHPSTIPEPEDLVGMSPEEAFALLPDDGVIDENGVEEVRIPTLLRQLVDLRDRQIQKARIQFALRRSAIERGVDSATVNSGQLDIVTRYEKRFDDLESEIEKDIRHELKKYPIASEMAGIRGLGPMLSAKLIALIDISRSDTTSSLWRFSGYAVIDGQRERLVAGEKSHYSTRLKTQLYLIGQSFMRSNSPYRKVYDDAKTFYTAARPDWTLGHRHMASLRKMIKVFLAHLWLVWRTMENLPVRGLYVHEKLMHEHMYRPRDFGWNFE